MINHFSFWRNLPLASKLSMLLVVLVTLPLVSVALANEMTARTTLLDATRNQNWQRAHGTADMIDAHLAATISDIQLLASLPDIVSFLLDKTDKDIRTEVGIILSQARQANGYDVLYLTDPTGTVLLATDEGMIGRNYVTTPWFLSAIGGKTEVGEPIYDPESGQVFIHFASPIFTTDGVILGTIVGRIPTAVIDSIIAVDNNYSSRGDFGILWNDLGIRLSQGSSSEFRFIPFDTLAPDVEAVMILDNQYGPDTAKLLRSASKVPEIVEKSKWLLYDPHADPFVMFDAEGIGRVQASIVPLKNKRWLYAIITPEQAILTEINIQTRRALALAFGVSLAAIIAALLAARWATQPIRIVAATASAIAAGNMTRRVGLKQNDEVGQLAATFDAMADALMEKREQLSIYAEGLEQKVQERTDELQRRLENLRALRAIDATITDSTEIDLTLEIVLAEVTTQLHLDAADILLFDPETHKLCYASGRGFLFDTVKSTRLSMGEGLAGRVAIERKMIYISDLQKDNLMDTHILADEGFMAYYGVPFFAKGQILGVLEIYHRSLLEPSQERLDFIETLANQAAIGIDNASLFASLQRSNIELTMAYDATIEGWSYALDLRDKETEGHSQRVTEMTLSVARAMGVNQDMLIHMRRGALLHDIGKLGVPDYILLKTGALTDEEWDIMRRHPQYAFDMLSRITYLHPALNIPYCHHERWDGNGYPRGLKGEQIPLEARIFSVVDVYDALHSDRPYRKAWPEGKIIQYIQEQIEKQFDPKVVERFLEMLKLG